MCAPGTQRTRFSVCVSLQVADFIVAGRLNAKIDKVAGVIETCRYGGGLTSVYCHCHCLHLGTRYSPCVVSTAYGHRVLSACCVSQPFPICCVCMLILVACSTAGLCVRGQSGMPAVTGKRSTTARTGFTLFVFMCGNVETR